MQYFTKTIKSISLSILNQKYSEKTANAIHTFLPELAFWISGKQKATSPYDLDA